MSELPYWMQSVQALAPTVVAVIAALIAGYIALSGGRHTTDLALICMRSASQFIAQRKIF
jgi:hypothetical protein